MTFQEALLPKMEALGWGLAIDFQYLLQCYSNRKKTNLCNRPSAARKTASEILYACSTIFYYAGISTECPWSCVY